MAILSGIEIRRQIELGTITIDPFDPKRVNQTSVDLTLGTEVAVYEDFTYCDVASEWNRLEKSAIHQEHHKAGLGGLKLGHPGFGVGPYDGRGLTPHRMALETALDTKKPARLRKWTMDPEVGWIICPGVGYLMHTHERVTSSKFNPVLDGKSSIGRLFIQVHVTAGYGEPGFDGQYTLEVTSQFPVRVYPGMRFCQMRFHVVEGEIEDYVERGHYKGDKARGAVASQVHETAFD